MIEIAEYTDGRRALVDVEDLPAVLGTLRAAGYGQPRDTGLRSGYGAGRSAVVAWVPCRGCTPLRELFDVGYA